MSSKPSLEKVLTANPSADTISSVTTPRSELEEPSAKEATTRACLALLGTTCVVFVSVGYASSFGVYESYYLQTMLRDQSASNVAWLGSVVLFTLFLGALPSGLLNDKFGPRPLMLTGTAIVTLSMLLTSFCTQYYQLFLSQAVLFGLGLSLLFCPAMATISLYFQKNIGIAMGIAVGGASIGGVIWPITLRHLLSQVGFAWTVRIAGLMMLVVLSVACLTVRAPITNQPKAALPSPVEVFKNRVVLIIATSMFFIYLGLFTPLFYITQYSLNLGLDPNMAFYMVAIVNATSLFGRVVPGFLADRYGPFNLIFGAVFSSAIVSFCWTRATTLAGVIAFGAVFGICSGAIMSLQGACTVKCVKPEQFGLAMGVVMSFLSIAALIGPPVNGQLLGFSGYISLSMFSGASMLTGGLGLMAAKYLRFGSLFCIA